MTEYEYDDKGIRVSAHHTVDDGNDGSLEVDETTTYLNDPMNHTGYSQVIEEVTYDNLAQAETDRAIYFFYGNFIHGVRRIVLDGIEPAEKASDSFQFHMIDYVYHQVLRKESDWLARDLFRSQFRSQEPVVAQNPYDHQQLGCLILYTCHEVMLDDLLERPIESGDLLSNANTIILMGKTREAGKMGRALQIAKHRGSACDESIVPYQITETGIQI
ncbi:MAG: hypothetical protein KDA65_19305 [Planctomycetaceae bacterium]|nr:hypothetical protein [Planctomycetaceae bacterium]